MIFIGLAPLSIINFTHLVVRMSSKSLGMESCKSLGAANNCVLLLETTASYILLIFDRNLDDKISKIAFLFVMDLLL